MSELNLEPLLPTIVPARDPDEIAWRGALAHIGPLTKSTWLHGELHNITSCGLYLLYIGCIGLISKRMAPIMNTNLNRCLAEQIFAYQFDWRYPATYGITLTDIDENPDKIAAIRRMVPYFFFDCIERTGGYFLSHLPVQDLGYVVNLTRHLCGRENKSMFDAWLTSVIKHLRLVARCESDVPLPVLQDYPDRLHWEAAVRKNHGRPLPIQALDFTTPRDAAELDALAACQLAGINSRENSLLKSPDALVAAGFEGVPYTVKH